MGISSSYPQSTLQSSFGHEELMCLLYRSFQDDIAFITRLTLGTMTALVVQTRVMPCRFTVTRRIESH